MKKLIFISLLLSSASSFAATYTVTSASNGTTTDGVSLRWAIMQANANAGADLIAFNIAGTPPHILALTSILPSLTDSGTVIDGTTQPNNGFSGVSPKIILNGTSIATPSAGILEINAPNCEIYGLYLTDFLAPNGNGIRITPNGSNFVIGGVCKGNVISGNGGQGGAQIYISPGVNGGKIQGNKIGTDTTGMFPTGSYLGFISIYINSSSPPLVTRNILLGGSNPGEGNLISGNGGQGSYCIYTNQVKKLTIKGNIIGPNITGAGNIGNNTTAGIYLFNQSDSCIIGGSLPCEGNIFAYHIESTTGGGIEVQGSQNNLISRNSFFCNGSWGPIQLIGGNGGLASPVINFGSFAGAGGTAPPNSKVELYYADTTCGTYSEGQIYFGTAYTSAAGNWNYSGAVSGGRTITALAIDTANNNTSAFSSGFNVIMNSNPVIPYCSHQVNTAPCSTPVGISSEANSQQSEIVLQPNPNNGLFNLIMNNEQGIMNNEISIYNMYGEKMYSTLVNSHSSIINLDAPSGIYFLKIMSDNFVITKKLEIIR